MLMINCICIAVKLEFRFKTIELAGVMLLCLIVGNYIIGNNNFDIGIMVSLCLKITMDSYCYKGEDEDNHGDKMTIKFDKR